MGRIVRRVAPLIYRRSTRQAWRPEIGKKEITADKILVDAGAMSVATMAQRDGLDHKAEVDAGAAPTAFSDAGPPVRDPVDHRPNG